MKFTLGWLKEYLDTNHSLQEICDKLTQIGLEVESVTDRGQELEKFKVVEITKIAKHPNADRLNICTINTIDDEFQLICGAPNVKVNMKAILAPLGSIIPVNQMQVKKVKIRGVESIGMLCSARELNIGDDHEGIIELANDTKIGTEAADVLGVADPIIEIAITPNRGDCLGVLGIARDLAASGLGKLKNITINAPEAKFNSEVQAHIVNQAALALNFIEVRNVKNTVSPRWLQQRLNAIGITPKSAIIDVTNYVAYCFGQPLHAYDKSLIAAQQISAEQLEDSQEFLALNDEKYILPQEAIVIKDQDKILALGGIIGGESSACNENTAHILLEAANFPADNIAKTGRKLRIDTDSRYRFERNIDPLFVTQALCYAANLIQEICAGEASQLVSATATPFINRKVALNISELNMIAATEISITEIKNITKNIGLELIDENQEILNFKVPSWRSDITISRDIIEEILRLRGFDKIPYVPFKNEIKIEANHHNITQELAAKKLLANLGLHEVITWSFYSKNDASLYELAQNYEIANPISNELSIMRQSLIPNLVKGAVMEQNKGNQTCSFFEAGKIFLGESTEITECDTIAAIRSGALNAKEVNNDARNYDIFDVKNDIYSLLEFFNIAARKITIKTDNLPSFMHPNRAANLYIGKKHIGYFGELHPNIAKQISLKQRLNLFELFVTNLPKIKAANKKYVAAVLQPVNRDFCFIVAENIAAGDIKNEFHKIAPELISKIHIFDLYQGEKIAAGKKSLAFNIILQPKDKSLTGEELELFNQKVINHMQEKFAAELPL